MIFHEKCLFIIFYSRITEHLGSLESTKSRCNIYTAKIKAIYVIADFIGGRGELNSIFMIRQCLNSTHSLSSYCLNKDNPNIFNGIFANQPLREAKAGSCFVPLRETLRGEVRV